jgi:2-keto-3-deoxy-L-rhamnonate aldolase RhmA
MVPRIDTAEQAREAISFLRWPPDGTRGLALLTRGAELGEVAHASISALNQRVIGVIQVESPEAVANANEVAAIDGVDVLFVGPTDLSHSMGMPGRFDDPEFVEALRKVVAATDANGKTAGILLRDASTLDTYRDLGFRFIGLGSDGAFVVDGLRAVLGRARA